MRETEGALRVPAGGGLRSSDRLSSSTAYKLVGKAGSTVTGGSGTAHLEQVLRAVPRGDPGGICIMTMAPQDPFVFGEGLTSVGTSRARCTPFRTPARWQQPATAYRRRHHGLVSALPRPCVGVPEAVLALLVVLLNMKLSLTLTRLSLRLGSIGVLTLRRGFRTGPRGGKGAIPLEGYGSGASMKRELSIYQYGIDSTERTRPSQDSENVMEAIAGMRVGPFKGDGEWTPRSGNPGPSVSEPHLGRRASPSCREICKSRHDLGCSTVRRDL